LKSILQSPFSLPGFEIDAINQSTEVVEIVAPSIAIDANCQGDVSRSCLIMLVRIAGSEAMDIKHTMPCIRMALCVIQIEKKVGPEGFEPSTERI